MQTLTLKTWSAYLRRRIQKLAVEHSMARKRWATAYPAAHPTDELTAYPASPSDFVLGCAC